MTFQTAELVLASKSRSRAAMLAQAGLDVRLFDAAIDERLIDEKLSASGVSASGIAQQLAISKAASVSATNPDIHVIGADQTLECEGVRYSKPRDIDQAARHLKAFSGKTHELHSAVALARDGNVIWSTVSSARLTVRDLSDDFIALYLAKTGSDILGSVGCYHYEGLGLQLFERVEGDFHTILGMPLLPLLVQLRQIGLVIS